MSDQIKVHLETVQMRAKHLQEEPDNGIGTVNRVSSIFQEYAPCCQLSLLAHTAGVCIARMRDEDQARYTMALFKEILTCAAQINEQMEEQQEEPHGHA